MKRTLAGFEKRILCEPRAIFLKVFYRRGTSTTCNDTAFEGLGLQPEDTNRKQKFNQAQPAKQTLASIYTIQLPPHHQPLFANYPPAMQPTN